MVLSFIYRSFLPTGAKNDLQEEEVLELPLYVLFTLEGEKNIQEKPVRMID